MAIEEKKTSQRCTAEVEGQQTQVTLRQILIIYHEISTNNENIPQEGFRMLKNPAQTDYGISVLGDSSKLNWRRPLET